MKYGDSFEVTDKNAFFKEQQEIASDLLGKLEQQEYLVSDTMVFDISIKSSTTPIRKTLGYSKAIKGLLAEPLYNTMEGLDTINRNKNRTAFQVIT